MPSYFIFLGPPGAGKGTQAQIVAKKLGLPHISSGEIFRENLKNETELGILAQSYMDHGNLVPDDVTIKMIQARLMMSDCIAGAVLDGFPRTTAQAMALDTMLAELGGQVNAVPLIDVPHELLVDRLTGRWTCRKEDRHIYHEKFNPPKVWGVCDHDGGELYQREDQKTDAVVRRIQVYSQQTAPLIDYYKVVGKLVEIDGSQPIDKVTADLLAVLVV